MSFETHACSSLFTATISFSTVRTEAKKVLSNSSHSFATLSCVLCKITGKLHEFDVSAQIQIDTYMLELLAHVLDGSCKDLITTNSIGSMNDFKRPAVLFNALSMFENALTMFSNHLKMDLQRILVLLKNIANVSKRNGNALQRIFNALKMHYNEKTLQRYFR